MSEYQYVGFRAIDAPLSEKSLKYMRTQSSHADITPWSFDSEYTFGDFHGNAPEMLRRGYDFYFHYANFGTRTLTIRLPDGLPAAAAAEPYFIEGSFEFRKDKTGPAGLLAIEPGFEPDQLEQIWEPAAFLSRLLPLRAEILAGDLRPFYLANLAVAGDMNHDPEEWQEPPVPAGLDQLTAAQSALAELYGLSDAMAAAAARNAPSMPERSARGKKGRAHRDGGSARAQYDEWLARQPEAVKNEWLAALMADPDSAVRSQILVEFRKSESPTSWPTAQLGRTIAELESAAVEIQEEQSRRKATAAAKKRATRLKKLASDPEKALRETEQLAGQRSTDAYNEAARLLADLRESLTSTKDSALADRQAEKLKSSHSKSRGLTAALRRQGFLKK
jgi:hypothetical protein